MYKVSCLTVKDKLQKIDGRFALWLDEWKSSNNLDFLAVTFHYSDDNFQLKIDTIGFENLNSQTSFTRDVLHESVVDVFNEYGIKKLVVSITKDNTGPINVLVKDFTKFSSENSNGIAINGDPRCAGHVFNLATKKSLKYIHFIPGASNSLAKSLKAIKEAHPGLGRSFEMMKAMPGTIRAIVHVINNRQKNTFIAIVAEQKSNEHNAYPETS